MEKFLSTRYNEQEFQAEGSWQLSIKSIKVSNQVDRYAANS